MAKSTAAKPERRDVHASLPRQDRHVPKGEARRSRMGRWRAAVLILVHVVIAAHIVHWLTTGSSLTPVEPSEAMQTFELGKINAGFVLFVLLIGSTLLFGRWFCGWACHVVALQDLSAWGLGKLGLRPRPVRSRLLVLTPWLVAFYMFVWPVVQNWLWPEQKPMPRLADWQWEVETQDLWATFPGPIMATCTFVVVGFLIVFWLGAKGFCTYGCPYGAFFAIADRAAPLRIKVSDACDACGHCTSVCSSNVRVHEEVARHGQIVDPGCMKCMDCVSGCPKHALSVGFALPKPFATSQQRIRARADFTWPEELLLAAIALGAFFAFRGAWFGEAVPLLMAVGLAVITAVLGLLLVRLVLKREVTFQHTLLKNGGRTTRAGRWAMVSCSGWLLFTAHTFAARELRENAIAAAREPLRISIYGGRPFDREAAQRVLGRVETAVAFALVADPILLEVQALLRGSTGDHAAAEAELTALHDRRGELFHPEAKLALASYWMRAPGRAAAAERLLLEVLGDHPQNRVAQALLQQSRAEPR